VTIVPPSTTCACHLVTFISAESLFVDVMKLSVVQTAVFHLYNISYRDEKTITLIVFVKSVSYLNLMNAKSNHVERINLRLYSLLVDFTSTLLIFAQVTYE